MIGLLLLLAIPLATTNSDIALMAAALLTGGTIVAVVNAVAQRRKVGADATAVVTAAARELVDPLRKELAQERADNADEVAEERRKVAAMREEASAALEEARALRTELHEARLEADRLRREREADKARIRELERALEADRE
jgi:chromosome segregation ATPase